VTGILRLPEPGAGTQGLAPLTALVVLSGDAALVIALAADGSILAQPGGPRYLVAPLFALAVYAAAVLYLTSRRESWAPTALAVGALAGAVTAVMWVLSLTVETFAGLSGWANVAATAPLLLGGFALWGVTGAIAFRRCRTASAAIRAAVAAAMMCVTVTVAFGFALAFVAAGRLERNINGSPEYLASHWRDLHAFAIANTLDAAFSHLLLAPIIAALAGAVGALIAKYDLPRTATRLKRR
jgi:hypothetical protein